MNGWCYKVSSMVIFILEILGTIAFAISGAFVAIRKNLDLFGVVVLGCTTACAGGLIRDLIINNGVPLLFSDYRFLMVAFITSLLIFFICYLTRKREFPHTSFVINIFDALGLGIFVVVGADVAIDSGYGANILLVIFVSVITGVGGGILRDILVGSIPAVLRKHIYAIAALIGSLIYYLFYIGRMNMTIGMAISVTLVVVIRILASKYEWSLPKIK